MSKFKNYEEYDEDDSAPDQRFRSNKQKRHNKQLDRAIKTRDIDALMELEDDE